MKAAKESEGHVYAQRGPKRQSERCVRHRHKKRGGRQEPQPLSAASRFASKRGGLVSSSLFWRAGCAAAEAGPQTK